MSIQTRLRFGFNIFFFFVFCAMAWAAVDFQPLTRYMPFFASATSAVLILALIFVDYTKYKKVGFVAADETIGTATLGASARKELAAIDAKLAREDGDGGTDTVTDTTAATDAVDEDEDTEVKALGRAATVWAWIFGYVAGIAIIGLTLATALYVSLYLALQARASVRLIVLGTVATLVGMHIIRIALGLIYPSYLLIDIIPLDFTS